MKLSDFILVNMESILGVWQEFFQTTSPTSMNRNYLRQHAEKILAAIATDLALPQAAYEQCRESKEPKRDALTCADAADIVAGLYGADQLVSGCGVEEMVSEFRTLRKSVLWLWRRTAQELDLSAVDDIIEFNDAVDQILMELIAHHTLLAKQSNNRFNDMLVHDLRNPLNAILMAADYLIHTNSLMNDQTKIMSQIFDSSQEMRGIVNDFFDFSRENFGSGIGIAPAQTDLAIVGRHAVKKIRQLHPDRMIVFESTDDLTGVWDHDRLAQAVCNLLENSLQHGSRTAPVTLKIWASPPEIFLTVHSYGEPIPSDKSQYIFEALRHYSSSSGVDREVETSLGLVLYVARAIVMAHGGTISVESALSEGTTFIVRLPRHCA